MKQITLFSLFIFLIGCGISEEEKLTKAQVACAIMAETRNMDGAQRVERINQVREEIGEPPYLKGDELVRTAFQWDMCERLVANVKNWEADLRDAPLNEELEKIRLKAEKQAIAEQNRKQAYPIILDKFGDDGVILSDITLNSTGTYGYWYSFTANYELKAGESFSLYYVEPNYSGDVLQTLNCLESVKCEVVAREPLDSPKIIEWSFSYPGQKHEGKFSIEQYPLPIRFELTNK